jgi:hypothetical protein
MRSLAMISAGADDSWGVAWLLDSLREMGARDQIAALLRRDPAAHVAFDNPVGVRNPCVQSTAACGAACTGLILLNVPASPKSATT